MNNADAIRLFSDYMKVTGTPSLAFEESSVPALQGKKLGIINGSSWVSLWSSWFGRKHLPGVKLVNVGNEAVQLNFMAAHSRNEPCPPEMNVACFCRYAKDLYDLYGVDAIMISCSTMNRAYASVSETMRPYGVPVIQIDEAMMEMVAARGGHILVIATHGPTVASTQALLRETAERMGSCMTFSGATVEKAFDLLGQGRVMEHNELIADTIRKALSEEKADAVVLAQLSMSVFSFSFPDPVREFGVPVYNSGDIGFAKAAEVLKNI